MVCLFIVVVLTSDQLLKGTNTQHSEHMGHHFLETEYRLFPPVTKFLDLFPRAGYFFNASD